MNRLVVGRAAGRVEELLVYTIYQVLYHTSTTVHASRGKVLYLS